MGKHVWDRFSKNDIIAEQDTIQLLIQLFIHIRPDALKNIENNFITQLKDLGIECESKDYEEYFNHISNLVLLHSKFFCDCVNRVYENFVNQHKNMSMSERMSFENLSHFFGVKYIHVYFMYFDGGDFNFFFLFFFFFFFFCLHVPAILCFEKRFY